MNKFRFSYSPNGGTTSYVQSPVGSSLIGVGDKMERCAICLVIVEFCGLLNDEKNCDYCAKELESQELDDQDTIDLTPVMGIDDRVLYYGQRS